MNYVDLQGQNICPSKIVCIGRNYVEHIHELNNEVPSEPVIFLKPNSAISQVLCSDQINEIHYEAELSFIIENQQIKAVGFGFDLTKRKIQTELKAKGLPWERAKAFDRSAIFSQFILFSKNVSHLSLTLSINGKLVQKGSVELMLNKPLEIIENVSEFISFEDADILMTGTPKGVGKINKGDEFVGKIFYKSELLIVQNWTVQ